MSGVDNFKKVTGRRGAPVRIKAARSVHVTLSAEQIEFATSIGFGNTSGGIRLIINDAMDKALKAKVT